MTPPPGPAAPTGEKRDPGSDRIEMFVSYAHRDATWFDRLRPVIQFEACRNHATAWNDQDMTPGARWDEDIRQALERADIFIAMVSYEYLASDYIRDVELKIAYEREQRDELEIVPVVIYPIDLEVDCPQLNSFNPLPGWGECWLDYETKTGHYQAAHKPIRDGLRQAIAKARARGR